MQTRIWDENASSLVFDELKASARNWHRIHQLPNNLDEWQDKCLELRERIWTSMGVTVDHSLDLQTKVTSSVRMDGYRIDNLYYQSRPGIYVTANLYIPKGNGPFPGVIHMHGHWPQGKLAERVQARGHTLARNGFVCLTVDAFGSGERSTVHGEFEYHGGHIGACLFGIGETLLGAQVADNMRGIDLLCSLDFVDSSNIGATGASGGGNQTMWLTAMDERVKASVPVVSVGSFESYIGRRNCVCECLPDGLTYMEESSVLALAAPRALLVCNCLDDCNPTFYPSEMLRSFRPAEKIYRLYNAGDNASYQIFNRPHGYWPEIRESMLGWFKKHLKKEGEGRPAAEIPFETLPEDKLMVFKKGERPAEVYGIYEYCRRRADSIKKEKGADSDKGFNIEERRLELAKLLRMGKELEIRNIHRHCKRTIEGRIFSALTIATACGRIYPVLYSAPLAEGEGITLLLSPNGKEDALRNNSAENILESKSGLLLIDLWATGETEPDDEKDIENVGPLHNTSRSCLWLGKTLMGEWTRDIIMVCKFAKDIFREEKIYVNAIGTAALAAMFAEALTGDFAGLKLRGFPLTLGPGQNGFAFGIGAQVPGMIPSGDVKAAAAMCGDKLNGTNILAPDGSPASTQQSVFFLK